MLATIRTHESFVAKIFPTDGGSSTQELCFRTVQYPLHAY